MNSGSVPIKVMRGGTSIVDALGIDQTIDFRIRAADPKEITVGPSSGSNQLIEGIYEFLD
jgi:hypothetical protein